MSLGENIYRLRTERRISQVELADLLEVSRQSVSKWETDASVPELDKLIKLSSVFEVTLDELVLNQTPAAKSDAVNPRAEESSASWEARSAFRDRRSLTFLAGVVLLCAGLLGLGFLILTGRTTVLSLLLPAPLILGGILCMLTQRPGLWCVWSVFLYADLFMRYGTGVTFRLAFYTPWFPPELNYVRLAIGWAELICILIFMGLVLKRYRQWTPPKQWTTTTLLCGWGLFLLSWLIPLPSFGRANPIFLLQGVLDHFRLALLTALLVWTRARLRSRRSDFQDS